MILLYGDLDLNDRVTYAVMGEQGFLAPEPTRKQQYSDSALRDGQMPTEAKKWNNRILTFAIKVMASTSDGLLSAVRALEHAVYLADATVTFCREGGTPIYFLAYQPEGLDPSSFFRREYQDQNVCIISWQGQGYSFGHTDRRFLYPARSLGPNDSFEKRSGDDFENWVEIFTEGA